MAKYSQEAASSSVFIVICRHMAMSGVSPQLFPILTSTLPPSMKVWASSKLFSYMVSHFAIVCQVCVFVTTAVCNANYFYSRAVPSSKSQISWEDSHEVCEEQRPDIVCQVCVFVTTAVCNANYFSCAFFNNIYSYRSIFQPVNFNAKSNGLTKIV
jgi:hypothetical protein